MAWFPQPSNKLKIDPSASTIAVHGMTFRLAAGFHQLAITALSPLLGRCSNFTSRFWFRTPQGLQCPTRGAPYGDPSQDTIYSSDPPWHRLRFHQTMQGCRQTITKHKQICFNCTKFSLFTKKATKLRHSSDTYTVGPTVHSSDFPAILTL